MKIIVPTAKTKLQILSTPIGNLDELSNRAIKALQNCQCILCEDTRVTSKLLTKLNIHNKELISYQKFNENEKVDLAINKIKQKQIILCSDAGYPCLSDPGYALVNKCYENNIAVEIINGPSSLMHSVVVSGLNLNNFYFNGFLPASKNQRIEKLKELKSVNVPIVFFESVHRIKQSLKDINDVFVNPYFVVCRELTKLNETIYRGLYDEIINDIVEKGEFVIVVQKQQKPKPSFFSKEEIIDQVNKLTKDGLSLKQAAKEVARLANLQASLVYNTVVEHKKIK
ncbi:MAG: 16S rRNA (cytidine(1402)-2'-O)-methyltransferase [Mycoplasmoidaceae bacterium]|nr:16S rRNA (cytidine(1402)-2'-O)-methyltransferase [Mycoplasmoidaceae bacterium]